MDNIYSRSKTGFKWTLFSNIVKGGIGLFILLFLTHYLGPEGMGVISIIMVIYGLSETFVQFGISQSIIAREKNSDEELSSIFWTNMGIGILVFIVVNLIARRLAFFYDQPEVEFLTRVLSVVFIVEPLDLVFRAILEKELRFPVLEKTNIFRYVVLGLGTVILVIFGMGVLGYVIAMIFSIVLSTVVFAYIFVKEKIWFPKLHFRLSDIKEHYEFGFYVTMKSFLNYAGTHLDELVIGRILGVEILGLYYFAKDITRKTLELVRASLNKVTFPLFSQIRDDVKQFRRVYLVSVHAISWIGFLLFGLFVVASPIFLKFFAGPEWSDSIFLVQIFSLIAMLNLVFAGFSTSALYALERPDYLFKVDLGFTPLRLFLVFMMAFVSIEAVVFIFLLTTVAKVLLVQNEVNNYLIMSFKMYFSNLKIPIQNVVSSFLIFLVADAMVKAKSISLSVIPIVIFVLSFFTLSWLRERDFIFMLKKSFL